MSSDNQIQNLITARRLMVWMDELRVKQKQRGMGQRAKTKSAKEMLAEDEAILSGDAKALQSKDSKPAGEDDTEINLGELRRKLRESGETAGQTVHTAEMYFAERTRTELSVEIKMLKPVDGLVVNDKQQAETDRYQFDFISGTRFKITDKWSGKSSTVWSDPYVDLSDVEGDKNGDFKDLKASTTQTTFQLQDGTRVTFTAQDTGVIEQVDIFKGDQHARGIGAGSAAWQDEKAQFFAPEVKADGREAAAQLAKGDVVVAGGDGNDWYDSSGKMVWGQTTGPAVTSRPAYTIEMNARQVTEQVAMVRMVDKQI
jgi:hypothetical protein